MQQHLGGVHGVDETITMKVTMTVKVLVYDWSGAFPRLSS